MGQALAGKIDGRPYRVYVLLGDGELAEGSNWEASMSAAHYALDNLVVIVDRNMLQITGMTEQVQSLEPLEAKLQAFGYALRTVDGNDVSALRTTFSDLPFVKGKPSLVLARTIKGRGVSFMENVPGWHHRVPNEDEYSQALRELNEAERNLKQKLNQLYRRVNGRKRRLGVAGVLIAGLLNGSFVVPMKKMKGWHWESTWLVFSTVGLLIVPWLIALLTVPHLGALLMSSPPTEVAKVLIFGLGWGIGNILFGLGVTQLGLALGYGIILGIIATVGSVLPLIILHPDRIWTRQGYALMGGMVLVLVGIVICAIAGRRRERETAAQKVGGPQSAFVVGLIICILSGVFSAMLNFAFTFGAELQRRALAVGTGTSMAANGVWALTLTTGFLANAAYCVYLLQKNRTWGDFSAPPLRRVLARRQPYGGTVLRQLHCLRIWRHSSWPPGRHRGVASSHVHEPDHREHLGCLDLRVERSKPDLLCLFLAGHRLFDRRHHRDLGRQPRMNSQNLGVARCNPGLIRPGATPARPLRPQTSSRASFRSTYEKGSPLARQP